MRDKPTYFRRYDRCGTLLGHCRRDCGGAYTGTEGQEGFSDSAKVKGKYSLDGAKVNVHGHKV